MITIISDNTEILLRRLEFSDGTLTMNVSGFSSCPRYVSITLDTTTKGFLVREELSLVVDAIKGVTDGTDFTDTEFILHLPYLYNSRADRRFLKGDSYPLHDFLTFLKSLDIFDKIHICDIHNMKALEDFEDLPIIEKSQLECFKSSLAQDFINDYDLVVAPDKGATEKAKTIADHLGIDIIYANKVRDISTGKIVDMTLPEGYDLQGKKVLVPDDITDKAGTHIWLSDILRAEGVKEVDLYVTHAILPDGLGALKGKIDKLICYQTVAGYINNEDVMNFNLGK